MSRFDISKVEAEIHEKGYWEESYEWRIFTETHFRITPIEQLDEQNQTMRLVYSVRVHCGYDLRCECPSLARSLRFCDLFQDWIMEGWNNEGWPGWAEKNKMNE